MDKVHQFQTRSEIQDEAYQWVLLFNSDKPVTPEDIAGLQAWVARSPVHKQVLKEVEDFWCEAEQLAELAVPLPRQKPGLLSGFYNRLASMEWQGQGVVGSPRGTAMALGFCVVVALFIMALPPWGSVGNGIYSTVIGEQTLLTMRDGTQLQLDTNSQVKIDYEAHLRRVYLIKGKAHFTVASNPDRPFEVSAGEGLVRAVGTAFSVYLKENTDMVEVVVDEGRVELERTVVAQAPDNSVNTALTPFEPPARSAIILSLGQGEGAEFDRVQHRFAQLNKKEMEQALAWRKGVLVFVRDPLGDVVSEVSRYTDVVIEVVDPDLKDMVMGGRFRAGEIEALLEVLEIGFGVKVIYLNKRHIQLSLSDHE